MHTSASKAPILTGAGLGKYLQQLIQQKKAEAAKQKKQSPLKHILDEPYSAFPSLLHYLLSLWAVLNNYQDTPKVTFSLIALLFEQAFEAPPKQADWESLLQEPYIPTYNSQPNTPEYRAETAQFPYLEKTLRNDIVCLKLLNTYGPEKLGVQQNEDWYNASRYYWDSTTLTTPTFLEAGIAHLFEETDIDENITWSDMVFILKDGRYA